ncbi:hypothetical protein D770_10550 [Flammeovirgaceae bacterium 311]|nr:hypothetical protein D770_10550 [Flammeovirgaceae bacterium 311]
MLMNHELSGRDSMPILDFFVGPSAGAAKKMLFTILFFGIYPYLIYTTIMFVDFRSWSVVII